MEDKEIRAAANALIAGLADGGELALCENGDGPVSVSRADIRRLVAACSMNDQELEAERLAFAESSDLIDGGPCESCGVIVHIDDFCGHENPDGTSTFFCPDCFAAEHPESNDTFIFLNETQTGPNQ